MTNVNYEDSAKQIVELVGGKENISSVAHCVTRVRFVLKDQSKASENSDAVRKVPGVLQVIEAGGQYQVVIGTAVNEMYDEIIKISGNAAGEVAADDDEKKKESFLDKVTKLVSGILLPVMPAMIGSGIVMCAFNLLAVLGLVNTEGGMGLIMYAIGQACIYFFPIIIGSSAAKYFKMDSYLGAVLGASLIYPALTAAAGTQTKLFGVIPLTISDYTSTVFPIIVTCWFASLLYKFLNKNLPKALRFSLTAPITLIVSVPLALLAIGPVTNLLSGYLGAAVFAIYNFSPILCGIILGATWSIFIIPLGLHYGFIPIFINNFMTLGYEPILGLLGGIMTITGVLVAVGLKTKNPETRAQAFSTAITNTLGISEPGLYGIILQHKETMISLALGGAIASIFPAMFHTYSYVIASASGIFGLTAAINPSGDMSSFIGGVLCNVVGFILCFAFTYFWKFDVDK